jgi:hypothetical protein
MESIGVCFQESDQPGDENTVGVYSPRWVTGCGCSSHESPSSEVGRTREFLPPMGAWIQSEGLLL